jgi:hypothetical protein
MRDAQAQEVAKAAHADRKRSKVAFTAPPEAHARCRLFRVSPADRISVRFSGGEPFRIGGRQQESDGTEAFGS